MTMSAHTANVSIEVSDSSPDLTVTDPSGISYTFPCLKCMEFWSNIHPSNPGFNRSMSSIEESFKDYNLFNENDWKKIWKIVKRLLSEDFNPTSPSSADFVSVKQFISVIIHFGCVGLDNETKDNCFFLEQINSLIQHSIIKKKCIKMSWFAGHMTTQKAEERLQDQPLETFLVRFSESEMTNGGFAVAVKAEDCVKHYVFMSQPCCDYDDDYDGKLRLTFRNRCDAFEETFPDLITFVRERLKLREIEGLRCKHVCPDLPFNADFRGYR